MVHHLVLFHATDKEEHSIKKLYTQLSALKRLQQPEKLTLLLGDEKWGTIECDILLYAVFQSRENLDDYMSDTNHDKVKSATLSLIKNKTILDYEA